MTLKSEFLNEINLRGFIYQATDIEELDKVSTKKYWWIHRFRYYQ